MEHKEFKELAALLAYEELNESSAERVREHLRKCAECRAEYEQHLEVRSRLIKEEFYSVDVKLLSDARSELRSRIREENIGKKSSSNFLENILHFPSGIRFALGSAFTLLIGVLIGYLVFGKVSTAPPNNQTAADEDIFRESVRIENVRLIEQGTEGEVEFTFDAVKPVTMKGNIRDQKVQSILAYSIMNEQNPGSRFNSIAAIKNSFATELDEEVKEAVLIVAQHDENPGVRREALKLLREFKYDEKIKNALLYVLMNDDNSGNRIESMNGLLEAKKQGYGFDQEDLSKFRDMIKTDENDYIKYQVKTVLEEKIQ